MTKRIPRVSIIMATYNRAHLLGKTIQSVLAQTYRDFELIVVDDGSADNTEKVVKNFNDEVVKYIQHEENKGAAAARNSGIKSAMGDYIAFQDSDDEWLPGKLEKQMLAFEMAQPKVGVVYTGCYRIQTNMEWYIPSSNSYPIEGDIFSTLLRWNPVAMSTVLLKKECLERAGMFDEGFPRLIDWELFIRISRHYEFKFVNEVLVISYSQPDSISVNQSALLRAYKLMLEKHFEDIAKDKIALSRFYSRIGYLVCSNGELSLGRSYLIRAVKAHPPNTKALGAAMISVLGQSAYNIAATSYRSIKDWFSTRR